MKEPARNQAVEVIGSGVVGLCCSLVLAQRGLEVHLISESDGPDASCCSWWAGGMLAPWCEAESAEQAVFDMGLQGLEFWCGLYPDLAASGTLVIAAGRDLPELRRFAKRTDGWEKASQERIEALEPELAERFSQALYFSEERFFDPRVVMPDLVEKLRSTQARISFNTRYNNHPLAPGSWRVDCRGLAARDELENLRGVKGEMLLIRAPDVSIKRPVRFLHPRIPVYIVPRENGLYMIGATMIENDERVRPTVRSIVELLSAAVVVHPAFAEAEIVEIGVDARPAFPDNCPRVIKRDRTLYANGTHRHGFLTAPALAMQAAGHILDRETTA